MSLNRKFTAMFIAINLISLGSVQSYAKGKHRGMNVMTYNMYLGAELGDLISVTSEEQLLLEVGEAYRDVVAGNVPARIAAIADQIQVEDPVLVGLQEVALWRTGPIDPAAPATAVTFDFLQMLLDELAERRLHYAAIEIQTNLDVELPGVITPTDYRDVRYTDRLVILARTDLNTSQFKLEGTQSENFAVALPVRVLGQPLTIPRGWASADVKFRGKTYRFVNAHLESFSEEVQLWQTRELLQVPTNTTLPVILVGDLNSDAEAVPIGTAYSMVTGAGFTDAWEAQNQIDRGFTWALSGEIPNNKVDPSQRIDFILVRGGISVAGVDILGEAAGDMRAGFRPSDHAGLSADVVIQP